jgi:hypothetical protein
MSHCECCGRSDSRELVVREQMCPACNPEYYIRNFSWVFPGLTL